MPNYLTVALEKPLGEYLAAQGVGEWSPNANYYQSAQWPMYVGQIPTTAPDKAILLNMYADDRSRDDGNPDIYVQIRVRGNANPFTATDKANNIFNLLHDRSRYVLGSGQKVLLSRRVVNVPREPDNDGRWHHIDSYMFTLSPS